MRNITGLLAGVQAKRASLFIAYLISNSQFNTIQTFSSPAQCLRLVRVISRTFFSLVETFFAMMFLLGLDSAL
ncbi:MAG: hypothetical protein KC547_17415, partial [Anaerolineae bacterium]|nr:hypothetical protein [Anaerolineae bacterium]